MLDDFICGIITIAVFFFPIATIGLALYFIPKITVIFFVCILICAIGHSSK